MPAKHLIIASLVFIFGCSSPQPESGQITFNQKMVRLMLDIASDDYYENGNIRIEKIINGNEEKWIFRQEDGGCWEEDFYRDGEIYKKIAYNSDCTKSAEYELKNSNRSGSWISYHENGKIREKGEYKEGIPIGFFEYFDENEKRIALEHNIWIDSIEMPLFSFPNQLIEFEKLLKSRNILGGFKT
jgi:hypothetical protein